MKILYGFTETERFLKRIVDRVSDEEYAELQIYLCENSEAGFVNCAGEFREKEKAAVLE